MFTHTPSHPQTEAILDDAEAALAETSRTLASLTVRVPHLQQLIEMNKRDLEVATNITDRAEVVAQEAERVSVCWVNRWLSHWTPSMSHKVLGRL